ncbi:SLBB domain-containing protein [Flavobacterium johnsoniae]|jgi:protein involved in polysaccharide export with SLBB domain|uniref:Polysaccharide export protein n=1 Tax=Flavobacterium johnsoniae (strain ATCC 17061 / DSM 2064 / JCM 8514 / BCRC 14874 / CCUG 350202 / NBRC 14942 / NCIMB 11054 / UW101) TaxID=376686 RepID=A5FN31_FLAJ1|nr:SLBB domain-containing protein [Flavobacterium johnsoniae]ABQ03389.1 polysaccharide export protein [Flavobacterium johnsoniae UW101]OXG01196.1 sugar transporter [Flavobacterium johnsoniae UW101]WQG79746.1 SLBB domain-containing protein [Flavobacterium johnsoniae UW101]SHL76664.1 protein involved in polysaccharide export, contains SLBB domain of the beta-grasp fold [Flavobacterium johnsoniae]
MKKIIYVLTLFLALTTFNATAQDIIKSKDLSTVRVDYMSDDDLAKISVQLKSNNTTIDQVESMALSKGMSQAEFDKLRTKLKEYEKKISKDSDKNKEKEDKLKNGEKDSEFGRKQEKIKNDKVKDSLNALIFGSELFDNPTLNFEPDLKLATPLNYVLGPGDELQISIYGVQEYNASLPVSVEGKIAIEYVGQIAVSGMTIEAATQKIKGAIARVYSTVRSGQSQVSVSLSGIRTIKVTIVGGKQPGNYSISSLATVYNALHLAGGPGKNGSYRNIELLRNNRVYKNIDIYAFLVKGDQSDNVALKDNDVIRIPAYSQRVTVEGEVKRPGIFEMKKGEKFSDLLNFASGFNEFAYTASVNVLQKTGKEFKVHDINESEYNSYQPQSGDVFKVTKILNRFENRIKIEGAVFRPDYYSFTEGMRIYDLITRAEGLKEDAYTKRARIIRLKTDLTTEIVNVDLEAALSGDINADILLKREDIVTVYSILDFREEYKITIDGEVKNPGEYEYFENLTLNDLVVQVGGLTGSASKRVEIARMIKSDAIDDTDPKRIELVELEITADNNEQIKNFVLKPFDVINVRRMAVYEKPEMVKISGAVTYPGKYVLANKKEKVYNVVMRAGGLTSIANLDGMKIKRPIKEEQIEQLESVNLNFDKKDISGKDISGNESNLKQNDTLKSRLSKRLRDELKYTTIPVNWEKIVKDKNHYSNVTLFPGDEIEVAVYNEGVKVTGNVLLTSEIPYRSGKGFKYYINSVGGVDSKGWKRKAYIIYPNGKAAVTSSFLFFKSYPKVEPDSQIVVPERPERKKMSAGEWAGLGTAFASLALLIVTAFK